MRTMLALMIAGTAIGCGQETQGIDSFARWARSAPLVSVHCEIDGEIDSAWCLTARADKTELRGCDLVTVEVGYGVVGGCSLGAFPAHHPRSPR